MIIDSVPSVNGVVIRLTVERWRHIVWRHPQLADRQEEVLMVVSSPDEIYDGDRESLIAVRRIDGVYLVVVYREVSPQDGFIITAYEARRLRPRKLVWKR